ncbi:hypothetical protein WA556_002206 [Blastocystis sp. ATCC 50177/Nand II]
MALMSLAPVFFVCIICSSILIRRDIHSGFLLLEMLSCTLLNQILKRFFKESRPINTGVRTTYGMPSDHSQFISCFCVYITLWLFDIHMSSPFQRVVAIIVLWIVWAFVVMSRLYLGEHTLAQVVVGVCVGLGYGGVWYWLDRTFFRRYYQAIAELPLFRWLEFKDLTNVPNSLEKEREMARQYYVKEEKAD